MYRRHVLCTVGGTLYVCATLQKSVLATVPRLQKDDLWRARQQWDSLSFLFSLSTTVVHPSLASFKTRSQCLLLPLWGPPREKGRGESACRTHPPNRILVFLRHHIPFLDNALGKNGEGGREGGNISPFSPPSYFLPYEDKVNIDGAAKK